MSDIEEFKRVWLKQEKDPNPAESGSFTLIGFAIAALAAILTLFAGISNISLDATCGVLILAGMVIAILAGADLFLDWITR